VVYNNIILVMKGKEFKEIRLRLGLSMPKLGKEIGKSSNQIFLYEKDKAKIPLSIERLMRNFDINNVKKK